MSWTEVKKINSDMVMPLDELIKTTVNNNPNMSLNEFIGNLVNDMSGSRSFATPGTHKWTCPQGVSKVLLRMSPGDGGGAGGGSGKGGNHPKPPQQDGINGNPGGNSSFGNIITITGGGGGEGGKTADKSISNYVGEGGIAGVESSLVKHNVSLIVQHEFSSGLGIGGSKGTYGNPGRGGAGGSGSSGYGGRGGDGGSSASGSGGGGGGGAGKGGAYWLGDVYVTPGTTYDLVVGKGGTGGAGGDRTGGSYSGASGIAGASGKNGSINITW